MLDQGLELGGIENFVLPYFIDYDLPAVKAQEPEWQQLICLFRRSGIRRWIEDRVRH